MAIWNLLLGVALAGPPNVSVGQQALLFSLPMINEIPVQDPSGVALSDYVGVRPQSPQKAVLLYFFTRREGSEQLDALNRMQKRFSARGVQVLAINADKGAVGSLSAWLEEQKLEFPVLRDNHHVVLNRYGFDELPFAVVVDKDGYIFAIGRPLGDDFTVNIEAELTPLLAQ
ncbi:MAG: TlpA disulfide reductase family protein [Myxococcota bacterium]